MKKNNDTSVLAEKIFQTLMLIPTKGGMTQLQISAVRDASERYLEGARATGDESLVQSVRRGISLTKEMQCTEEVCKG